MKKFLYIIMCGVLLLSGCEEDNEPLAYPPTLVTGAASEMTRFEAVLSGTAVKNPASIIDCEIGFMVSESRSMSEAFFFAATTEKNGNGQYAGKAKNCEPGKEYYFCIYAKSGNSVIKGDIQTFKTVVSIPPVLGEPTITSFDEKKAALSSEIGDEGGYPITDKGFVYKIYLEGESDPTLDDDQVVKASMFTEEQEKIEAEILDMLPSTTYVIRAYATNKTGTGYSEPISLTTDKLKIPLLTVSEAGKLTAYTATLSGTITDEQGYPVTEQGFCWSAESRQPTINGKHISATATDKKFTATVGEEDPLLPNTRYYLRAYATNEKGTGYSTAIEFTTRELQMASLTKLSISDVTINSVGITAQIVYNEDATINESGFSWSGTEHSPTVENGTKIEVTPKDNKLTSNITGLEEGKTYYATAYARTRDGYFYSEPIEFSTEKTAKPAISTPLATDVEETTAIINATITNTGGSNITAKGICWSKTNKEPSISDEANSQFLPANNEGYGITLKLGEKTATKLQKGTKYFVRAYATNKNGINYSATAEFNTAETYQPTLSNFAISETTETSGRITAKVTDGGAPLEASGVCYSLSNTTPAINDASGTVVLPMPTPATSIDLLLQSLEKGKVYNVRAYATNRNGTGYSVVGELRTMQNVAPVLTSITVMNINDDNALAKAFVSSTGGKDMTITAKGFVWTIGQGGEPTLENCGPNKIISQSATNNFEATLTGLLYPYRDYTVRAYATNTEGLTGYSEPISFRTGTSEKASISNNSEQTYISNITSKSARVRAVVESDGGAPITETGVCWSSTTPPSAEGPNHIKATLASDNSFTVTITGLTHETYYNVRAYAINKNGTAYSDNLSLTTEKLPPSDDDNPTPGTTTGKKPSVYSPSSSGTFKNRLEIYATIHDDGGLPITAKGFVWSETNSNPSVGGEACTHIPITTEGMEMNTVLRNLKPGTTYYVSAYATNEKGTTYASSSFSTEAEKEEPNEGDNPTPGTSDKKTN